MVNIVKTVLIILNNLQKAAEATGDLIGNKIANKIMKDSNNSEQNYSEIVTNDHDKEIPNDR